MRLFYTAEKQKSRLERAEPFDWTKEPRTQ